MTTSKIKTILEDIYGISNPMDRWMKIKNISTIFLNQDAKIFLTERELYYFDTDTEELYISKGPYASLSANDVKSGLNNYDIYVRVDMNKIEGFISSSALIGNGIYNKKRQAL